MKKSKLFICIVVIYFILVGLPSPASAKSTVQRYRGTPSVLVNKYWKYTPSHTNATQYFYGTHNTFVAKHTYRGSFRSSVISWMGLFGYYVIQGVDSKKTNYHDWWFIKPNKNFSKIRFGFITIPQNDIPKHEPAYYANKVATRTSLVTAILH